MILGRIFIAGLYVVFNGFYVFWLYQSWICLAELVLSYWIKNEIELWIGGCDQVLSGHKLCVDTCMLWLVRGLVIGFHPMYRALLTDCEREFCIGGMK